MKGVKAGRKGTKKKIQFFFIARAVLCGITDAKSSEGSHLRVLGVLGI